MDDSRTYRAKHREFMLPAVANYYEEPVVLNEGQGCRVKDLDGGGGNQDRNPSHCTCGVCWRFFGTDGSDCHGITVAMVEITHLSH